jgi:hypothetical protein
MKDTAANATVNYPVAAVEDETEIPDAMVEMEATRRATRPKTRTTTSTDQVLEVVATTECEMPPVQRGGGGLTMGVPS